MVSYDLFSNYNAFPHSEGSIPSDVVLSYLRLYGDYRKYTYMQTTETLPGRKGKYIRNTSILYEISMVVRKNIRYRNIRNLSISIAVSTHSYDNQGIAMDEQLDWASYAGGYMLIH